MDSRTYASVRQQRCVDASCRRSVPYAVTQREWPRYDLINNLIKSIDFSLSLSLSFVQQSSHADRTTLDSADFHRAVARSPSSRGCLSPHRSNRLCADTITVYCSTHTTKYGPVVGTQTANWAAKLSAVPLYLPLLINRISTVKFLLGFIRAQTPLSLWLVHIHLLLH